MNNGQQHEAKPKKAPANIVGPQIRKIRYAHGLSQNRLAIKLQLQGLDIARDTIAHIECQTHCVQDKVIPLFAEVLGVSVGDLFPPSGRNRHAA